MRLFLTLIFIFFSSLSFGSNISVTIDGKTYSCSGDGQTSDCSGKVAGLRALMKACMQSTSNGAHCLQQHWHSYKSNYSSCVYDAIPVCLKTCMTGYSNSGYCTQECQ